MAEPHVIGALRNKRAELAGTLRQLEQQFSGHRANLAHLDATMRLFDPDVRPKDIRPRHGDDDLAFARLVLGEPPVDAVNRQVLRLDVAAEIRAIDLGFASLAADAQRLDTG